VLADKYIEEKTPEQFAHVFETKVDGFGRLLAATADDPLRFIVAFTSVAAQFGNVGQTDYAAANEVLNKVCQAEAYRRKGACLVRAINWGAWEGGMVSPELARHMKELDFKLIPLDGGAAYLREVLERPNVGAVEMVAVDRSNLGGFAATEPAVGRRLVEDEPSIQAAE
ncbi:MAG: KR domain-containing protein, partial [Pseudomonadota bacterium]